MSMIKVYERLCESCRQHTLVARVGKADGTHEWIHHAPPDLAWPCSAAFVREEIYQIAVEDGVTI